MKKKEVIYYEGNAFPPPVDDRVELKDGNKGIIGHGIEVQLYEEKLKNFWNKMEEMDVWKWYGKYPHKKPKYESLPDQVSWELKIKNH